MKKKIISIILIMILSSSFLVACTQEPTNENNQPGIDDNNGDLDTNDQQDSEDTNNISDDNNQQNTDDTNEDDTNEEDTIEDDNNQTDDVSTNDREVVLENDAFQIYQPAPGTEVKEEIVVKGLARVYEGTVLYEFEDGHYILDEGFTTASEGAPGWGEFEITIKIDEEVANNSGSIVLFEESAEDGSRKNELIIPVKVSQ